MELRELFIQLSVLLIFCSSSSLSQVTSACGIWGMPCPVGPCAGFTCGQNARCSANQRCECLSGYEKPCTDRATAVIDCTDIDECQSGTHRCPSTQSRCVNHPGGYSCMPFCKTGYANVGTGVTGAPIVCRDIDECRGRHHCHTQARCVNTDGSYTCECLEGYEGDGQNCAISRIVDDLDECQAGDRCHRNAECTNTVGSFQCACAAGYLGDGVANCNVTSGCDLFNFCHVNATCLNDTSGNSTCQCAEGYTGDGVHECSDIDECEVLGDSACGQESTCTNSNGSFNCTCVGDSCSGVTIGSTEISFNDRTLEYFGIGLAILASLMTALILGWLIRRRRRRSSPLVEEYSPADNPAVDDQGVTIEPIRADVSTPVRADLEQGNRSRGLTPETTSPETSNSGATPSQQFGEATSTSQPLIDTSTSDTEASPDVITPITSDNVHSEASQFSAHTGNEGLAASALGRQQNAGLGESVGDAGRGSVPSPQSTSQANTALDATLPVIDEIEVWQGSTRTG